MYKTYPSKDKGFTTLEILLVVALIAIVAAATVSVYFTAKRKSDLDVTTNVVVQYIRRSQIYSQSGKEDSTWGVYLSQNDITLYMGDDYLARDQNYDDLYNFPASLTRSGLTNIVFSKLDGIPSSTGTITFSDNANNISVISINSKGLVDY